MRERFEKEFTRRFKKLRRAIVKQVKTDDGFGLITNADWSKLPNDRKLSAFEKWLKTQVKGTVTDGDYWTAYANEAYEKGLKRTHSDINAARVLDRETVAKERGAVVRNMLRRPESKSKLKMMASRIFTDLEGVTQAMSTQMSRILVEGLANGDSPNVIAAKLSDRVDKIGITRAKTIARTEIVRVHAEAQLDMMQELGIEKIGVMVEWHTSSNPCPLCAPMGGTVLTLREARGLIPRHPNCVCAFIPANVGESRKGQKRGHSKVRKAIDTSKKRGTPKSTQAARTQGRAQWAQGKRITKKRPRKKIK